MIVRIALLLALALLPACAAEGPHTQRTEVAADGPTIAEKKVDPDPEHISTGGKVALGMAAGVTAAAVGAIVIIALGSAMLMSNMGGP